jgi:hypothetical protein
MTGLLTHTIPTTNGKGNFRCKHRDGTVASSSLMVGPIIGDTGLKVCCEETSSLLRLSLATRALPSHTTNTPADGAQSIDMSKQEFKSDRQSGERLANENDISAT